MHAVIDWLASCPQEWLLVFDGADQEPHFISQYLPGMNRGNVLISTRNMHTRVLGQKTLEIAEMSPSDAIALLLSSAYHDLDSHDNRLFAADIAEELCYMPLALNQASSTIASGITPLSGYLSLYWKSRVRLSEDPYFKGESKYGRALYPAWDISLQEIVKRSSSAIALLHVFAFMHFEGITEELFQRAATSFIERGEPDISNVSPALDVILSLDDDFEWDVLPFREAIRVLTSFSFLKPSVMPYCYRMHRLIHTWVRDRMTDEERVIALQQVNMLFKRSIPDDILEDHGSFCRTLAPHIISNRLFTSIHISLVDRTEADHYLFSRLGRLFQVMGFRENALLHSERALELRKEEFGVDHELTLRSMDNVASILRELGEYGQAMEMQLQVITARKRLEGDESFNKLQSMGNLAGTFLKDLRMQMRQTEACSAPSNLSSCNTLVRSGHTQTSASMNSIALTFKALERYNRRHKLQRTWLPAPSTHFALHISNDALYYRESGQYTKALEFNLQALDAFQQMFGPERRYTLRGMNSLASTYSCLEEYEKAEELFSHVLNVRKRLLGAEHLDTLSSMHNLAVTYYWLNRPAEAEDLLDKVIQILNERYRDEHVCTWESDQTPFRLHREQQTGRIGQEINGLRISRYFERF
jgi:tetratricopeptide (TPR) repeat protein